MGEEKYKWSPTEDLITEYNTVGKPRKYLLGVDHISNDHIPEITAEEAKRGYIIRYFTRQVNYPDISEISEISRSQYVKVKNVPLYRSIEMRWKIAGSVENIQVGTIDNPHSTHYIGIREANLRAREIAERKLPGMIKKLPDLLQYRISE